MNITEIKKLKEINESSLKKSQMFFIKNKNETLTVIKFKENKFLYVVNVKDLSEFSEQENSLIHTIQGKSVSDRFSKRNNLDSISRILVKRFN